ncbi:MAG TPA: CpaF family protein [Acidimicrobiia bacterium]|nr:CpaF family protein [Acidimicrobiia bacterium]
MSRIVERLVDAGLPLRRRDLLAPARRFAEDEAPLRPRAAAVALDAVVGLGPLEPLLGDDAVSDVLVNGPDEVWVERSGALERTAISFADDAAVIAMVERVVAPLGLRIDRASPAVDARLADGSRLHALVPPASVTGPVVAIRRFTPSVPSLDALVEAGSITEAGAASLRDAVADRHNLLVCGGTGAGKTTLLDILLGLVPAGQRVVTVEDAAELRPRGHAVRLEARPPNAEGAGEITLRSLVRHALRLRPDRIVVGEVRGPEALDLIQAMSTGHDGSMGTVHANGPDEAMWRLETLALTGDGAPAPEAIRRQLWSAVDLVVHVARRAERRVVAAIAEVRGAALEVVGP